MEVPSLSFIYENSSILINGILKGDGLSIIIGPTSDYSDILFIRVSYVNGSRKATLTFDESSVRSVSLALKNPYSGCNLLAFFDNYIKGLSDEEKLVVANLYPQNYQNDIMSTSLPLLAKSHHMKRGNDDKEISNKGNENNSNRSKEVSNKSNENNSNGLSSSGISVYQKIFNLFLIDLSLYLTTMSMFIEQQDLLPEPPSFTIPFGQLDSAIFYGNSLEYMLTAAESLRQNDSLDQYYIAIINFANRWSVEFASGPNIDTIKLQGQLITLMAKNAIKGVKALHADTTRELQDGLGLNKVDGLLSRIESLEKKYNGLMAQVDKNSKLLEENASRLDALEKAVANKSVKVEDSRDPRSLGMVVLTNEVSQANGKRVSIMKPVSKFQ